MSYSLRGSCFGGQASLGSVGGVWDDLFGETPNADGKDSNFTSCPAGYQYNYNPSTNSGSCVPYAGTTLTVDGKPVSASGQTAGGCPTGFKLVYDANGSGNCVATGNVSTTSTDWGNTSYAAGSTSQNPSCPDGYAFNTTTKKCVKSAKGGFTTGSGTTTPKPTTPVTTAPVVEQSGVDDWLPMAAAAALLAGGGYLVWKKKQKKAGRAA